jgi:hypothetical protein
MLPGYYHIFSLEEDGGGGAAVRVATVCAVQYAHVLRQLLRFRVMGVVDSKMMSLVTIQRAIT